MNKATKDGHWTVYKLPHADNYVGCTGQFKTRMYNHKTNQGRNSDNPVILGVFDNEQEAREVERMFHDRGYPGLLNTDEVKNKRTQTRKVFDATQEGVAVRQRGDSKRQKPIIQKTLDGTIVAQWPSIIKATEDTGITNLFSCCRDNSRMLPEQQLKQRGGFIWEYEK